LPVLQVLPTLSAMTQPEQAKNVFKQIFSDGWAAFLRLGAWVADVPHAKTRTSPFTLVMADSVAA